MIQGLQTCALCAGMLLAAALPATAQAHVTLPGIETMQLGQAGNLGAAPTASAPKPGPTAPPTNTPSPITATATTPATGATPDPAPPTTGAAPTTAPATTPAKDKHKTPDQPTGPVDSNLHLQPGMGAGLQIQGAPSGTVPWSIIILLTGLTLIPSILLCVTPFARLLIVFHFLRQALGLQTTPSNQTLIGLSLILTFFLMQPVATQVYDTAIIPMQSGQITATVALDRGEAPLRRFMSHYVRDKDVALFIELAKEPTPKSLDDVSMRVLLPAYILSELKAGFQIGTVLFLPFLIVDMVVASITTSVGMLQLPPVIISTPLKLLLFLMVDGWHLLVGSLMRSFN
jgi:flagellar biosynthetic protein FliP